MWRHARKTRYNDWPRPENIMTKQVALDEPGDDEAKIRPRKAYWRFVPIGMPDRRD